MRRTVSTKGGPPPKLLNLSTPVRLSVRMVGRFSMPETELTMDEWNDAKKLE